MSFIANNLMRAALLQGHYLDPSVVTWAAAVVTAGGTVSTLRKRQVSVLVNALKAGGAWDKLDDAWLLVAESEIQALVSLKQLRTAVATNSPTFTADRGYAFDGATNYINTGFIPGTHAVAMTGSDLMLATYERTNVAGNGARSAGLVTTVDSAELRLDPRRAADTLTVGANCTNTNSGAAVTTDSRGLTAVSRNSADMLIYKNGALFTTITPAATASVLPTHALYIGCQNLAGVAGTFGARTIGWTFIGASLTGAQQLAAYTALQSFMTAVGAQV